MKKVAIFASGTGSNFEKIADDNRLKEKQSSMKMIEGKINVLTQENLSRTTSKESEVV